MKYKCPKCNNGNRKLDLGDTLLAICSFGSTLLVNALDPDKCDLCKGKGYLED